MALDAAMFESILPSRFITFTIPNPVPSHHRQLLRVAVLDSPVQPTDSPRVALMFVPKNRHHDWIFSTESGHLQLLLSCPQISRLILIGDQPMDGPDSSTIYHRRLNKNDAIYGKRLEDSVMPMVIALSRNFCVKDGIFDLPILNYEDDVVSSVVLERFVGAVVGDMLVEDVEIETHSSECGKREFRRRLRFKRLPNLIQTEIRIVPEAVYSLDVIEIGERVKFRPDVGVLVHAYLVPMVASCTLIGSYIEEQIRSGLRPKAVCVGVGGGALVSFLNTQLCFEVVGIEKDKEVLSVARRYFGLENRAHVRFHVGDAIEFMEMLAYQAKGQNLDSSGACGVNDGDLYTKFDVIMVDLDSDDVKNGISAPPLEFVTRKVLLAARLVLSDFGIFVINVIPPNRSFYETLIQEFREVFCELYEIDVGNGENFVLIATISPIVSLASDSENTFMKKLRLVISGKYMDSINKI